MNKNVYLRGSVNELGNWAPANAIGPMFNAVIKSYPTWYYDVSVPAGTAIQFKFMKKNGSDVTCEGGLQPHVHDPCKRHGDGNRRLAAVGEDVCPAIMNSASS
ncbi:hypothetical protein J23TS9_54800 [Paenibacillus sp. J23TS9]|nr:hypothetical protein J23TS9_54800 [Paenibacillus sp. J23TS9]